MRLELESPVRCVDGPLGVLADIVIEPTKRRVTHLVVEQHHEPARLVPIELVGEDDGGPGVSLRCTVEDARRLPTVHEFAYLRLGESLVNDPDWDVGIENVLAVPYYRGPAGFGSEPMGFESGLSMTYDRIPKGEVEIRRASEIVSSDGQRLGHVDAFLVDSDDQITHLVLEYGHRWGRREVAVPIGSVSRVATDSMALRLTKDEVGALSAEPATSVTDEKERA